MTDSDDQPTIETAIVVSIRPDCDNSDTIRDLLDVLMDTGLVASARHGGTGYRRTEIVDGTGFPRTARFIQIDGGEG